MAATAVTPTGVRDGDPDALAGLCDVRGPAVYAYCEVVAGRGERAAAAATDAFGSFRAGVVATTDLGTLNPELLLVSATRHAAARYAAADVRGPCAAVPGLLAARADRSITLADHDWLDAHLASCWTCRAPVSRFKVADRAYKEPTVTSLAPELKAAMVAAMTASAPVRGAIDQTAAPAATPAFAEPATNGNGAHAARDVAGAPVPGPPVEHALPTPGGYVDQPTSFYEMPAEDLTDPDPPAVAPPARPRLPGRGSALLGAFGRGDTSPARGRLPGRGSALLGAFGLGDTSPAPPDAPAAARAPRAPRISRVPRGGDSRAAESNATATAARGTTLPRPRRATSGSGSQRRRDRGSLRPAVVVPVALVVIAIIAAFAIAGVFGGGEPASAPQSYAPNTTDTPTSTTDAKVVVVPGAATATAAAVEKAKALRRAAQSKPASPTATPPPPPAVTPAAAPTDTPPPPPPPPPPPSSKPSGGGGPKIDADNGATGAEALPPAKDTSTVPDLAPPVEPAVPPPG